jgi:hypothetical protein
METNFVIIGLPASGKTTFLAALWHLVESGETQCRLVLNRYDGDLAYLNRIAEAWRNFEKVPRTSQVGDKDVIIHLRDRETGSRGAAFFPDLAGETFDAQVEARHCRPEFVDAVARGAGILFFVSADIKQDAMSVVELNAALPAGAAGPAGTDGEANAAGPAPPEPPAEWGPRLIPTQVRVVQLLSDLLRAPFDPRRRRLTLLISAWDLARGAGLDPDAWLASRMPLVHQFLRTNGASFEHRIFGVSAQGVDLGDNLAVDRVAGVTPSRRIQIVGPDGDGHDLTLPLVWLMSPE